jgi:hypothetical protein
MKMQTKNCHEGEIDFARETTHRVGFGGWQETRKRGQREEKFQGETRKTCWCMCVYGTVQLSVVYIYCTHSPAVSLLGDQWCQMEEDVSSRQVEALIAMSMTKGNFTRVIIGPDSGVLIRFIPGFRAQGQFSLCQRQ